jgi:hypothetical protein
MKAAHFGAIPVCRKRESPAANMIVQRALATAAIVCFGLSLGSCSTTSSSTYAGYVADHWPHWAGGMPDDVPPRPGAPGYDAYIAHSTANQGAANQDAAPLGASSGVKPVFSTQPPPPNQRAYTQPAPLPARPADDGSVAARGLY